MFNKKIILFFKKIKILKSNLLTQKINNKAKKTINIHSQNVRKIIDLKKKFFLKKASKYLFNVRISKTLA